MDYSNRTYSFINTSDIGSVDFSQVMETSAETVRKSIDESQFILKWIAQKPMWRIIDIEPLHILTSGYMK